MVPGLTTEEGRLPLSEGEFDKILVELEKLGEESDRLTDEFLTAMVQTMDGTTAILKNENEWLRSLLLLPLKERLEGDEVSEGPV